MSNLLYLRYSMTKSTLNILCIRNFTIKCKSKMKGYT